MKIHSILEEELENIQQYMRRSTLLLGFGSFFVGASIYAYTHRETDESHYFYFLIASLLYILGIHFWRKERKLVKRIKKHSNNLLVPGYISKFSKECRNLRT